MNARRWLSRWLIGAGLAGMLTVTAVVAQNRETLETDVSVNGNEVTLKWSKKHPWDAELIARGASLYAEYRTARSAGVECLQQPGNASPQFPGRRGAGLAIASLATQCCAATIAPFAFSCQRH